MTSIRMLAGIAGAFLAGVARAQSSAAVPSPADLAPGVVQTTLGLALVVGIILGAAWLTRRFMPGGRGGNIITVIATQALGQRERVVLIEVAGQWLLLGVAAGAVNLLQTLPKGESTADAKPHPFAGLLAAARSRRDR
jgi:flagellar protein FliO/FliZ